MVGRFFKLAIFLFVCGCFCIPTMSWAATYTWDGGGTDGSCGGNAGDGNKWSCAANWSSDTVPLAADTAVFSSTSTKNATVDSGFSGQITTVNVNAGYTGTLTLGRSLTATSNFTQAVGTVDLASNALTVNGTFSLTGGTFSQNGGTIAFGGTTSATLACNGATFAAGSVTFTNTANTKTVGSGCTFPLGNNPTLSAAGSLTVSSGVLSGTGTLTKTSGTLSLASTSNLSGFTNLTTNALSVSGTFDASSLTTVTVTGTFSLSSGTFTAPTVLAVGGLNFTGGTFTHNNGTVTIMGTTSGTLTCNGASFYLVTFTNTGGGVKTVGASCTLPLGANPSVSTGGITVAGVLSGSGTLTKPGGTLTVAATSNLSSFTGLDVNNLTLTGSFDASGYSSFIVNGALTLSAGTFTAPPLLGLYGTLSITSGTFAHNNGTVTIGGTTTATVSCSNAIFNLVTFTNTGTGTKTISGNCTLPLGNNPSTSTGIVVNSGTMTASGVLTFNGVFTNNGTVTFSGTEIHAKRNFNQLGTFNLTGKTLIFDGISSRLGCSGTLGGTVIVDLEEGSFVNDTNCTMSLGASPEVSVGEHFTNYGELQISSGSWGLTSTSISTTPLATLTDYDLDLSDAQKWRSAVVGPDDKIYAIPDTATDILIIDPATNTATRSNMGATLTGAGKWYAGALAANGKIYAMPYEATSVLVIDPLSGTATTTNFGLDLSDASKWTHAVLAPNGKIYGLPVTSPDILVIDPALETAVRTTMGANLSGSSKWRDGCLGSDGKIYGIPYDATDILIIDPNLNTATRSSMGATLPTTTTKYSSCVTGNDGKIYGIPQQADQILIIDPLAGTATLSTMGADLSGTQKWAGGVVGPDGKIYGFPFDGSDFLVIDTAAGTATRTNMGTTLSNRWIGGVLGPDDKIYAIPSTATDVITLDFEAQPTFTNAGTVSVVGSDWDLSGFSFRNQSGGSLTAPATMTVGGDWENRGTFIHNSGLVTLSGNDQSVSGDTTFYDLTKSTALADTLTLGEGDVQTIAHNLVLQGGSAAQRLTIESSEPPIPAGLLPQGGVTVSYLDVSDNTNLRVAPITCSTGCVNGGGNTNWLFTSATSGGSSVTSPTVTVLSPQDGVVLVAGDTTTITWRNSATTGDLIDLEVSFDGGLTFQEIERNLLNDSSYVWTVPEVASSQVLLRATVTNGERQLASDVSTAFTIIRRTDGDQSGGDDEGDTTGSGRKYIRGTTFSTVYYLDAAGRHPFPDERTYFTYEDSWAPVAWIPDGDLADYPVSSPMLPKPGVVLVKIMSSPEVYEGRETEGMSTWHHLTDEDQAATLYGPDWSDYVIDVEPTYWWHFRFGEPVTEATPRNLSGMKKRLNLHE